ncbi:MAG: potassium/proton antiporter [Bacteroidaceae bacterium]|nr:potassium/proton antiporter [Bacteroidaceae bacterium]
MDFLTSGNIIFVGSILIFCSILITKAGGRFGMPTLLLFLLAGMLFGCDGLGIQFSDIEQAQFVGMVALCVILFTGGVETRIDEIKPVLGPGLTLSTVGVLLTTAFTGLFIYGMSFWGVLSFELPIVVCFLLAATMSSTDSASVFNILRGKNINLKNNLQPMLELESGSNDPMAYILTIVLIQLALTLCGDGAQVQTSAMVVDSLKVLVQQFASGAMIGAGAGFAASWLMNRINIGNIPLYSIMLLSMVFFTFSVADMLGGNGYLAVYITGIIVGNKKIKNRKQVVAFFDGMTWIMQIGMFLLLGLLVDPSEMWKTALVALLVGVFMMVVARPLSVFISLLPFKNITFSSRLFASWVGLRGAVPIIFAMYPVVEDVPGSDAIFNIVFFITLLSLVLQGGTIVAAAKKLDLLLPVGSEKHFDVELPEEAGEQSEILITEDLIAEKGNTLQALALPRGMLVIFIKRAGKYIVPNGSAELLPGDVLLVIASSEIEG